MPSTFEYVSMFIFDFVYSFLEFILKLIYIFILFVTNIITSVISRLYQFVPFLFKTFSTFLSFTFWMSTHWIQGILGMGDKTTNTLSWLILLCGCYLYFDYKGYVFRPTPEQPPAHPEETTRNSPTRHGYPRHHTPNDGRRRSIQNIIEQLNSRAIADNQPPRPRESGTSREHQRTTDSETQHEVENQENENEANSQEEADRTRVQDDNLNNSRREQDEGEAIMGDIADTALCIVCLDRQRNAAVFPCGHTHLCLTCVQRLCRDNGPCPICQSRIEEYRQIFV